MKKRAAIQPVVNIESVILTVRGEKVLLDMDLARIYGVPTKRLNEQVKRNPGRFPDDFVFQLTADEKAEVVANCDHLRNLTAEAGTGDGKDCTEVCYWGRWR